MSAGAGWIEPRKPDVPGRDRCTFCARELCDIPLTPAETVPHCPSRGCRWCGECYRGETSVSPTRKGVLET